MDIQKLKNAGICYDDGLRRFANKSELYEKYLVKFFEDDTFLLLGSYLDGENYVKAFKAAHTLKGISGNLSMTDFYKYNCDLVELLRNSDTVDKKAAQASYNMLTAQYNKLKQAILS